MRALDRLLELYHSNPAIRKAAARVKNSRRAILVNLSLTTSSVLFALFLSELTLRLMGMGPLYVSPERDQFWKYDPLLGWAHQPGQQGIFETEQFRTTVRINENGLRDPEHTYERQNGLGRILVLGDSFAWGYGVEESDRFSQRLEEDLGIEVINAGVSGYSTDQELLWYSNEGIKYETDLVILVFAGNDVGDNDLQIVNHIYYKPKFVIEDEQLIPTGYPVPETSPQGKFVYSLSQRSALAYFLVHRFFDLTSLYSSLKNQPDSNHANSSASGTNVEIEPFKLTIALINEIRNLAESNDAKFMIVTTERWWNAPSGDTYEEFVSIIQNEGVLALDVESMPGFESELMLIPDDGHWNQSGHEFVAETIKELIETDELLPTNTNKKGESDDEH